MTQQDRQSPLKTHVLPLTALVIFSLLSLIPVYSEAMGASDLSGPASLCLIAYTLRDSAGRLQIVAAYADGSSRKQLTSVGDNGRPDWSPDGTRVVFSARRGKRVFVAVMDADGSNQRLLIEGNAPDWSPDGKQMVFILITNPDPEHPQPEIGIMNSDGTDERILTTEDRENIRVEKNGTVTVLETAQAANAPAWSPVDNRVAFWSGIERRYGQVWVMHADGTGSAQLTEDPTHRNSDDPSWSPEGSKMLFSTGRSGRNELWVMDANGRNERKLFNSDAGPFPGRASWQPVFSVESSNQPDPGDGK